MSSDDPRAASTEADPLTRELLQSVVDVARAIFGAQASSIFLLDDAARELVFQAVSGQGERHLVGRRFPTDRGIAGWVALSGEPMILDDLSHGTPFDLDIARSTAYVPQSLMAAPLIHREQVIGVLEVLDPVPQVRSSLNELDLLMLFSRQAAAALRVLVGREAQTDPRRLAAAAPADPRGPAGLATALDLVESLRQLLEASLLP